jgi:hypothetical protein
MSQLVKTKRQANFEGFKRFGAFKGLAEQKNVVFNSFVCKLDLFWHQLKKENIQLNKEIQSLQETSKAQLLSEVDFQKLSDVFLPPKVACFVKGQMDLLSRAAHGRRYSNHFKEFALSLYFLGPKCYRQLQKTFCLPSTKVLQRFVDTVNFAAGFNKDSFAFLKVKLDKMSLDDRICVLCINEMALKRNLFYNYFPIDLRYILE